MKKYFRMLVTLALMTTLAPLANARSHPGMDSAGSAATFAKIFGNNTAFTATAHMTVTHQSGRDDHTMDVKYFVRNGKVRMNMDLSQLGKNMSPEELQRMKQMGMEHYVVVLHPGSDNHTIMMYPDLKAYLIVQPPKQAKKSAHPRIDKTRVGTDTVDGHPCDRYQLIVTHADGSKGKMTEWEATDMHNFPIKLEASGDKTTSSILFKDIDRTAPAASLFEVPADYKKYDNMRQLMMSQMGKMMGNLRNMMQMRQRQQH